MSVPKNYHTTVNLPKMVEALNSLNFYTIKYSVNFTDDYKKKLRESELNGDLLDPEIEVIQRDDSSLICIKNFSAINDDEARRKITEWLDVKIENTIIIDYNILDIMSNNFQEELEYRGLDKLIS